MISETLSSRLQEYAIGPKIRALRQEKGVGLVQLGQHSGLSSGLLSKIERGILIPPLPTLLRIAMVFGVGLDHFFAESAKPLLAVVRRAERIRLPNDPQGAPAYVFESLDYPVTDRRMEVYLAEFQTASKPHIHSGTEFIFVLQGQLVVTVDGAETILDEGDAVTFDPAHPHSYRPSPEAACSALVVVLPEARSRDASTSQTG